MIPFVLRKLYVDLVDEQGTVWIFYFVELGSLGFRQRLAGVEKYPRTGPPSLRRVVGNPVWPDDPRPNEAFRFRLGLAAGPVEFSAVSLLPPWVPAGPPLSLPIKWHVVAPRLVVTLRCPDSTHPLSGVGYADFVTLRGLPRSLGVRHLRWGRAHGPEGTFVFTSVVPRRGNAWQRAALWRGSEAPVEWDRFDSEERPDGLMLQPANASGPSGDRFALGKERILRQGDTVDSGRFPQAGERLAYRLVMGSTAETRWAGSSWLDGGNPPARDSAVHESVDFGAAASAASNGSRGKNLRMP